MFKGGKAWRQHVAHAGGGILGFAPKENKASAYGGAADYSAGTVMCDFEFLDPKQLLKEIRASMAGRGNTLAEVASPVSAVPGGGVQRGEGAPALPSLGEISPAVDEIIRKDTALRMECIKVLRQEEALTVQETADLLILEPSMVKSQFLKLRQLGLIEQAGCRETKAGIQAVYRLNVRNPALEFVLAPAPEGMRSPHEVAEQGKRRARSEGGPE